MTSENGVGTGGDHGTQGEARATPSWWSRRTPLEKVGVVALTVVSATAVAALAVPGLASAAIGGALTAAGAKFLGRGFRKARPGVGPR